MSKYPHLLSPKKIGNHVIKNRMMFPNACPHFLQGPETFPAEGMRAFHANLARNGAAIVTIAEWDNLSQHKGPMSLDATHFQAWDLSDPSVCNYLSMQAEEVHFHGSKLLICARATFPEGYSLYGRPPMGPPRPGSSYQMAPQEVIDQTIANFVEKMKFYHGMGYDGFSMRCDMEILNVPGVERNDAYSPATMESRSLFLRQLYAAVKKELGDDFIAEATIAWEQPWGYGDMEPGSGVSADEVMTFCKLIDKDVDIFQVREHDGYRSHPMGFNFKPGEHPAADYCRRMKQEGITALLAPIGGFQEPEEMEQLLADGACDMFAMARAFFADPEYGTKLMQGRSSEIVPCLKCNKCHGEITNEQKPWTSVCSVNPKFGLEHDLHWLTAGTSRQIKNVAVIGGGPAGMRAAVEAAKRGHKVTLFEKTDYLGGQLRHAEYFDFKWPVKNYRDWLVRQLEQYQIRVVMNCAPSAEEIRAGGFDAVFAATGADAKLPGHICGVKDKEGNALYPTCDDVWGREDQLGHHVIMVGGSDTCMETAIYLLRAGPKVTMLTRQKEVAHDASKLHYITWVFVYHNPDGTHRAGAEWEKYPEFTGITEAVTIAVDGNTVKYLDREGQEHSVSGDSVVLYGGRKKHTEEALAYAGTADQFLLIGDCTGTGNIQACSRQAFAAAAAL